MEGVGVGSGKNCDYSMPPLDEDIPPSRSQNGAGIYELVARGKIVALRTSGQLGRKAGAPHHELTPLAYGSRSLGTRKKGSSEAVIL